MAYTVCLFCPPSRKLPTPAEKAAGEDAVSLRRSVVALVGARSTDPTKIRLASPKRCRRDLGPGVTMKHVTGTRPVYLEGIACQPIPDAIEAAAQTMGPLRAGKALRKALEEGYITQDEASRIEKELSL